MVEKQVHSYSRAASEPVEDDSYRNEDDKLHLELKPGRRPEQKQSNLCHKQVQRWQSRHFKTAALKPTRFVVVREPCQDLTTSKKKYVQLGFTDFPKHASVMAVNHNQTPPAQRGNTTAETN